MLCITKTILEKYEGEESCVHIPEGVTTIGALDFKGNKSLKAVYLPDSATQIENFAFWGCQSLREISIPDHIENKDSILAMMNCKEPAPNLFY